MIYACVSAAAYAIMLLSVSLVENVIIDGESVIFLLIGGATVFFVAILSCLLLLREVPLLTMKAREKMLVFLLAAAGGSVFLLTSLVIARIVLGAIFGVSVEESLSGISWWVFLTGLLNLLTSVLVGRWILMPKTSRSTME